MLQMQHNLHFWPFWPFWPFCPNRKPHVEQALVACAPQAAFSINSCECQNRNPTNLEVVYGRLQGVGHDVPTATQSAVMNVLTILLHNIRQEAYAIQTAWTLLFVHGGARVME